MEHSGWLRKREIKDNRLLSKAAKLAGDYLNEVVKDAEHTKDYKEKAHLYKIAAQVEEYIRKTISGVNRDFKVFLVDYNLYDNTVTVRINCVPMYWKYYYQANTQEQAIEDFLNS